MVILFNLKCLVKRENFKQESLFQDAGNDCMIDASNLHITLRGPRPVQQDERGAGQHPPGVASRAPTQV